MDAKSSFKINDRVVCIRATTYGAVCLGTVEEVYGQTLVVHWDGRYSNLNSNLNSNLKKTVKFKDVAPISELEKIKARIVASNKRKREHEIETSFKMFEEMKSEDGWLYESWTKLPLLPTDLEKHFNYEEKWHPEKGYLWAIKISKV